MRPLTILRLRLRTLFAGRQLDRDLEEELCYHLDCETQRNIDAGMPAVQAQAAAILLLGRPAHIQEQCRDERHVAWITGAMRDFRDGVRDLRRTPGFAAAVIVTLGLGIGANTAVFSIVDTLLFKALPVHEPERLFQALQPDGPGLQEFGEHFAADDYAEMRTSIAPFAQLAAQMETRQVTATLNGGRQETVRREPVSGNYFAVMDVGSVLGRTISEFDDLDSDQPSVAVISYRFWTDRLGQDAAILGRTIRIGRTIFQIAGVAQAGYFGAEVGQPTDVWTPLESEPPRPQSMRTVRLIGRLMPNATLAQATDPLQAILHRRMVEMAGHAPPGTPRSLIDRILRLKIKLVPAGGGISPLRGGAAKPLLIVFGLVALVLVLACATVATLFEARRSRRQEELAVRISLGASRWRLLRQLLCEALVLAGAGAGLGLILLRWTNPVLMSLLTPAGTPLHLPATVSGHVLAFTTAVAMLTALAFGLIPAWRASAVNPIATLRRNSARAGERPRTSEILVAFQVCVSLVLVVGATSFVRTLINLSSASTGFDHHNLIVADVEFRGAGGSERLALAWRELERRVSGIAGVESASIASGSPFNGASGNGMIRLPGPALEARSSGCVFFQASADYFKTTGIAIVEGRDFEPRDFAPDAPPTAVVSEGMVRQFFAGSDPVGRTFSNFEDNPPRWVTVVGVARDTKFENLRNLPPRLVYFPYTWPRPATAMSVVLRARRDAASLTAALRREASLANPDFVVRRVTTQTRLIDDSLVRERLLAIAASFFGVLALLLAVIGLYGITCFTVAQRTAEIGIRMALGASRGAVLGLILWESALVVTAGAAAGMSISIVAERLVAALLFGVKAYDAATFGAAASFVLLVTAAAALVPALRAARTDPAGALRCE